jgi:hypothetical protein
MTVTDIIALAEAAAKLMGVIAANVETGKQTLAANDIATLKGILDPLHEANRQLGATLDAALATAEKG